MPSMFIKVKIICKFKEQEGTIKPRRGLRIACKKDDKDYAIVINFFQ